MSEISMTVFDRRRVRSPRGLSFVPVMIALALTALVVAATLNLAVADRKNASNVQAEAQALSIAEFGLNRTLAYVNAINTTDPDLDRALDPLLNTTCTLAPPTLTLDPSGVTTADDNMPQFTDPGATPVPVGSAGKRFMRVDHNGGAYFVRIEDNDDDAAPGVNLGGTDNNATTNCKEGPASLGTALNDPIRDRDRSVVVTVMGIFPGNNPGSARATRTLRVKVAPGVSSGVVAGGDIDLIGHSSIDGLFGSVNAAPSAGGPSNLSCVGSATAAGPSQASGTCGCGGPCTSGANLSAAPMVSPFDPSNAPLTCTTAPCTPFYYLRHDTGGVKIYMWNYSGTWNSGANSCANPRQMATTGFGRICMPGESTGACPMTECWGPNPTTPKPSLYSAGAGPTTVYLLPDGSSQYVAASAVDGSNPPTTPGIKGTIPIWQSSGWAMGSTGSPGSCSSGPGTFPPGGTGNYFMGKDDKPGVTFTLLDDGTHLTPRGVWFVEGNLDLSGGSPSCSILTGTPGWGVSFIVAGDVTVSVVTKRWLPAAPKGYVLLVGRDLHFRTGNAVINTCAVPAAILVREQLQMQGNDALEGQLIVENAGTCSSEVTGPEAINLHGNPSISVDAAPPVASGPLTNVTSWSETSL